MPRPLLRLSVASLAASLAVGAAAACSSSIHAVGVLDDGGDDAAPDAADALDAGDAGVDADGALPEGSRGSIFAISDSTKTDGGAASAYSTGASFTRRLKAGVAPTTKNVGPCLVEHYTGAQKSAKTVDVSAGTLTLQGGLLPITLKPKADLSYPVVKGPTALWNGGETLTLKGDGDTVPAFTLTLTAPSSPTVASPAPANGTVTVTRSQGVTATFSGGTGTLILYFDVATETEAFAATCSFSTSGGTANVPAAAFADFPAGLGTIDAYVEQRAETTAGEFPIRFTATSTALTSSGDAFRSQAKFE